MKLSKREKQVLEELLLGVNPSTVATDLGINEHQISVHKTRARRKTEEAKKFLKMIKRYDVVLYPRKRYKGIGE